MNGVMGPLQMAENTWVIGVTTPINGVLTPLITSRGPPCINLENRRYETPI